MRVLTITLVALVALASVQTSTAFKLFGWSFGEEVEPPPPSGEPGPPPSGEPGPPPSGEPGPPPSGEPGPP
ncbi:hypothetical protein GWI33_004118, partial [Rhynchophorus ferrugineus]